MDARQRQDLDRYITGNYGEDQFKEKGDIFAPLTGHELHWGNANRRFAFEKMYDPTDDGPEVEVIQSICTAYSYMERLFEALEYTPLDVYDFGGFSFPEAAL